MLRFPRDDEHHFIGGMNGSGKTQFAMWCLSRRSYPSRPWIIFDFKREAIINKLPQIDEIGVKAKPPRSRGLYVVRPNPEDVENGHVTRMLWDIWKNEKTGVYIDEGYSIPKMDRGLQAILTQGRSKQVPVIYLSQRPAWISPFVLSETNYKSVFYLPHPRDVERMEEWIPPLKADRSLTPAALPRFASFWYNQKERQFAVLDPCPGENEILDAFDARRYRRIWF